MNKAYPYPIDLSSTLPSFSDDGAGNGGTLNLQQVLRAVRRRLMVLVLVVASIFSAVAYVTFQMTPIYEATSTVIVDQRNRNIVDMGLLTGMPNMPGALDTELGIITSPVLLERVVRKLDLHAKPEFNWRLREKSGVDKFKDSTKSLVKTVLFMNDDEDNVDPFAEMTPAELEAMDIETATKFLGYKINASRVGRTFMFRISAQSEDRPLAMDIANAIADQYLVDQLEAKYEATRRATAWLDVRLSDLKDEVSAAESAVEVYRSENGLLSARGETLTEQQISEITAQLIVQEANYSERQARLQSVRAQLARGAGGETIAEVNSEIIGDLRVQHTQVIRERAELESRYGPNHPEMIRVKAEEDDLRRQIDAEIKRIVSSLESEVAIARQRVASLRASLSKLRTELTQNNQALVRLRELERNAEVSRTFYEEFLTTYREANEQEAVTEADARILSYATLPDKAALPKIPLNLMLGLVLGVAAAASLVLLLELLDNRVSSGEEVEENFGQPFLGNVPLLPGGLGSSKPHPARYLVTHPMSAFAESMRNLRAAVKFADIDNPAKLVTITSSFPHEGKTSLSLSLARMSAMTGARTLVIDGDFRRRQLTETSGLKPKTGLIEHLMGEVELEEAIQRDTETELDVLPLTKSRNTTRDVFGSKAFDALMTQLKSRYDLIVIDTAPILLMAESRVIAAKSDQVIVAARWRRTSRAALHQTLGVLREFNARVAGVALTFVDLKRLNKHSGAALSNYKAYSKYYVNN